jgi:hypothetical protein
MRPEIRLIGSKAVSKMQLLYAQLTIGLQIQEMSVLTGKT